MSKPNPVRENTLAKFKQHIVDNMTIEQAAECIMHLLQDSTISEVECVMDEYGCELPPLIGSPSHQSRASITREQALGLDRNGDFYADLDEETSLYCVFGTESGFAYSSHADQYSAEQNAIAFRTNFSFN